ETPIGWIPAADGLDTEGLGLARAQVAEALRVDRGEWLQALADLGDFYDQFGSRLPQAIAATLADTRRKRGASRRSRRNAIPVPLPPNRASSLPSIARGPEP